jgi:hypothetical protein
VEQGVMDDIQHINPPLFQWVMDTPRVPNANNPTSKQVMQTKVQMHKKKMRGNTPGALPLIICPNIIEQLTKQLTVLTVPLTKCQNHGKPHQASKGWQCGYAKVIHASARPQTISPCPIPQLKNNKPRGYQPPPHG